MDLATLRATAAAIRARAYADMTPEEETVGRRYEATESDRAIAEALRPQLEAERAERRARVIPTDRMTPGAEGVAVAPPTDDELRHIEAEEP